MGWVSSLAPPVTPHATDILLSEHHGPLIRQHASSQAHALRRAHPPSPPRTSTRKTQTSKIHVYSQRDDKPVIDQVNETQTAQASCTTSSSAPEARGQHRRTAALSSTTTQKVPHSCSPSAAAHTALPMRNLLT